MLTRRELLMGTGGLVVGLALASEPTADAKRAPKPTKTPRGRVATPTPTATPVPIWSLPGRSIQAHHYVEHFGAWFDTARPLSLWAELQATADGGPFFAGLCLIGEDRNYYGQVGYGFRHDLPDDDHFPVGFLMVNEWGFVQPSNTLGWKLEKPDQAHRVGIEYRPAEQTWVAWIDGIPKRAFSAAASARVQPAIYTGTVHHNEPGYEQRELRAAYRGLVVYGG